MTALHMETDAVRTMASQLKQATEVVRAQAQSLNSSTQSIDWLGPSRDEFAAEAQAIIRAIEAQAEAGVTLAGRVELETAEWEQAAASLGGSNEVGLPNSGGIGAWTLPALPYSQLTSIFAFVTVAPWLDGLPGWMHDLYRKFFPAPIPVSFPEVTSTKPELPSTGKESLFGKLIEKGQSSATPSAQPAAPVTPLAQPEVRYGYDTYYDISPKSQGAAYGGAACLPTSVSMLTYYYHNQNPDNKAASAGDLIKMLDKGDGTPGRGVGLDKLNDDLHELGYQDTRNFQSDMTGLKDELKNGPLVVNVKVKLISTPDRAMLEGNSYNHSILVKGVSGTNVLVNDPWSGKEMEIPSDQFERMWSNGDHWAQVIRP